MECKESWARSRGSRVYPGGEAVNGRVLQCMACGHMSEFGVVVSGDERNAVCTCARGHGSFTTVNYHDDAGAAEPEAGELAVLEEIDPRGEDSRRGREMRTRREA